MSGGLLNVKECKVTCHCNERSTPDGGLYPRIVSVIWPAGCWDFVLS